MELFGFVVEFLSWSYLADMLSKEHVVCCDVEKKEKKVENCLD